IQALGDTLAATQSRNTLLATQALQHDADFVLGGMMLARRTPDTVAAAMLSVSLSTPSSHHGVLISAMLIILVLLWIEARRYRFFDVYRSRVRQFERHYFAQIFSPQPDFASNWLLILGEILRSPKFLITRRIAFARRLQRNYIHILLILLLAWILKISTPNLQDEDSHREFTASVLEAVNDAALGPLPGYVVVGFVATLCGSSRRCRGYKR
ncbi:MAG: hypothetical protein JWM58_3953, partial [Rhizobium sp.]|nr:hypothetical protein [Rhizobium sp.]